MSKMSKVPKIKVMGHRLWVVQIVEVVYRKGQKSEIRDQLYT